MIGTVRRFPFFGLILFGLGFFVASALAGTASSIIGLALYLPFLLLKVFLVVLVFSVFLRFLGRGRGRGQGWCGPRWGDSVEESRPYGWHHAMRREGAQWRNKGRPYQPPAPHPPRSAEEGEWEEHLRQARREVDDLDAPYNDHVDGTGS
ncbi:MAG: hypothetical protein GY724_25005 [Actinomycetia bacterium]|nr:hypothetical protein [Actinomycetes bacterium]MCP4227535.1 hypothetical protein [Actinomycetes bacterium]MCP5034600.1 hypothetical protein [Actinomycetes bacterium]